MPLVVLPHRTNAMRRPSGDQTGPCAPRANSRVSPPYAPTTQTPESRWKAINSPGPGLDCPAGADAVTAPSIRASAAEATEAIRLLPIVTPYLTHRTPMPDEYLRSFVGNMH